MQLPLKDNRLHGLAISFLVVFLLHLHANAQSLSEDRTTESGEAAITDPNEECSPYSYPLVGNHLNSFPPIWEAASILSNDSAAQTKWNSISASIPTNISVKVTQPPPSNYSSDDPDCWWTASTCTEPKLPGLLVDITSAPEPSTLGYGFDDGPNCSHNAFYDFLQSQNQKATLYYIGSNVADWPLEAQRALADGHEICAREWLNHCMINLSFSLSTGRYVMQMIKLAIGVTPTCWRPPYGDVDDRIRSIAEALGLQTIMWKYDSQDADINGQSITEQTVDTDYNNFIQTASNGTFNSAGAIILTHELDNFTMSEAVKFYPQLKSSFQHIVPVGVSLNKTQPYVETNYSLPTFEQYIAGTVTTNGTRVSPNSTTSSSSESSTLPTLSSSSSPSAGNSGNGTSAPSSNASNKLVDIDDRSALMLGFILLTCFYIR
ncbi:carbohydrate esterase family 4 protein [Lentinula aciculospora]|uniref:chitin deacetylase n=1 Tax=Lentinula aciculospora TaxID=153920 RepID=A0A9W8ZVR4_9AGAR|nr:carbohydrate esterase family 4 protein [Lentinula aciculospora]